MKHPAAIDAFEVELRSAKNYLDEHRDRPERWVCVKLLRGVLKTGFAALYQLEELSAAPVRSETRPQGRREETEE